MEFGLYKEGILKEIETESDLGTLAKIWVNLDEIWVLISAVQKACLLIDSW